MFVGMKASNRATQQETETVFLTKTTNANVVIHRFKFHSRIEMYVTIIFCIFELLPQAITVSHYYYYHHRPCVKDCSLLLFLSRRTHKQTQTHTINLIYMCSCRSIFGTFAVLFHCKCTIFHLFRRLDCLRKHQRRYVVFVMCRFVGMRRDCFSIVF